MVAWVENASSQVVQGALWKFACVVQNSKIFKYSLMTWNNKSRLSPVGCVSAENYYISSKPHRTGLEAISIWTSINQSIKMTKASKQKHKKGDPNGLRLLGSTSWEVSLCSLINYSNKHGQIRKKNVIHLEVHEHTLSNRWYRLLIWKSKT